MRDFASLDSGFCGIVESLVNLSLRERGFYFWQKPKVAKAFTHCVWDFAKLHFAYEILQNSSFGKL